MAGQKWLGLPDGLPFTEAYPRRTRRGLHDSVSKAKPGPLTSFPPMQAKRSGGGGAVLVRSTKPATEGAIPREWKR